MTTKNVCQFELVLELDNELENQMCSCH